MDQILNIGVCLVRFKLDVAVYESGDIMAVINLI